MAQEDRGPSVIDERIGQALIGLAEDFADLDRLKGMLPEWRSEADLFHELRLDGSEEFHSNFLAWLLDPRRSHGLGEGFLQRFLAKSGAGSRVINSANRGATTVTRERHVELDGVRRRFDIQISNKEAQFICVIEENKVWSEEGDRQLADYRQALVKDYPDYQTHLVFLTPAGTPPGDTKELKHWRIMTYADVLELVEGLIHDDRDSPNQDVIAFLRQYAITLRRNSVRRNSVPDVSNDVHQLAQGIYRKHQAAIDLIIENKDRYLPNYVAEATLMFRDAVDKRRDIWLRRGIASNRPYERFIATKWAKYESVKLPAWPNHLLLFEIHITGKSVDMYLLLAPGGAEPLRKKIFDRVKENPDAFDCQQPHYTEQLIDLHRAGEILTESDYENWWNEDAIRSKIDHYLDDFAQTRFRRIDEIIVQCLDDYEAEMR